MSKLLLFCFLCFALFSCVSKEGSPYTKVKFVPSSSEIEDVKAPFHFLAEKKEKNSFEEELFIGDTFLNEKDLYQAVTAFKRAKILAPKTASVQRNIDYKIMETYFIGGKYQEAINIYETGPLYEAPKEYPYVINLFIMVTTCYEELHQEEKHAQALFILQNLSEAKKEQLETYEAIQTQDFCFLKKNRSYHCFLSSYEHEKKNPTTAAFLNGILPGAGFFYVGQKQSAVTSLIINTLFTLGAIELFNHGYPALGLIVTSLELGWYVGGINGSYLAAKEYNNALYQKKSFPVMKENKIFPLLLLEQRF